MSHRVLFGVFCLPLIFFRGHDSLSAAQIARDPLKEFANRDGPLPDEQTMTTLAEKDPILFLEWCLTRYNREVQGYRLVMKKQERIKGKLLPSEEVKVVFREKPFGVVFVYEKTPRPAQRLLYVEPKQGDKRLLQALPNPPLDFAGIIDINPDSERAMESSRYPLYEFGLKIGMQRTLGPWIEAQKRKDLHLKYLGVKKVAEAGNRECWAFRRYPYAEPEDDGVADLTIYVDKETWLQVGSTLKNKDGNVIGEYFFRDIELNPKFDDDVFTKKSLQTK